MLVEMFSENTEIYRMPEEICNERSGKVTVEAFGMHSEMCVKKNVIYREREID